MICTLYFHVRESKVNKDTFNKTDDRINDELDTSGKLNEKPVISDSVKIKSPRSNRVKFVKSGIDSPTCQSLPEPRHQSCGAISNERSNVHNDCHIEEDAKSIIDEDCQVAPEKSMNQEEISREYNHTLC